MTRCKVTIIVLLDYLAAFDTVDHAVALNIYWKRNSEYCILVYSGSAATYQVVHSQP